MNVVDTIRAEAKQYSDKTAVIAGDRRFSYRQLFADIDSAVGQLRSFSVKQFDRVGIFYPDSYEYIMLNLAILQIGAIAVPISYGSPQEEVHSIAAKIDLNFLITFQAGKFFLEKYNAKNDQPAEFNRLNPAFIRFSSGTTGVSKGVVLSHQTILERTAAADKGLRITAEDVIAWVLQMSFHFVVTILLFLRKGATIALCADDFPASLADSLIKDKLTFMYASPFHYITIAQSPAFTKKMFSSMRCAVSTAMRLPVDVADKFKAKFGFTPTEAYGIIEVGLPFINSSGVVGSVGKLLPDYQIKIKDPDKNSAGKILLKGPGMADAYFVPFRRRSEIFTDGWFDTGDLGRIDERGFLYILGRDKNVINFAGMKIFPEEVEAQINQYPGVSESLVYPVKHPQYGELPAAKIMVKEKHKIDIDELRRFCYKHLAKYKVPKEFDLAETLEKTSSGKLKRGISIF